ncbi:leucyl aminopeptidase family protein [Rhodoplanes sp. SY1]|uniref:leucyl aminopeptidase family protein n=1 Tax=Rhodoplanes sp. SY1 TaxID=3166646 RepID=UPI0038B4434A
MQPVFATDAATAIPIWLVDAGTWPNVRARLDPAAIAFAEATGFEPKPGRHALLPDAKGRLAAVVFGVDPPGRAGRDPFLPGRLPALLPRGTYRFAEPPGDARLAALAFALGAYRFGRYHQATDREVRLVPPDGAGDDLACVVEAVTMARDLVNTPSNDMGPAELEAVARKLAERHGGAIRTIVGDDLLAANLPLIHAVGRASTRAPRLIDIGWGDADAPKVTLVGKGVCFDTGGLDIKGETAMRLMKKDMGGAATVLALAHMIMGRGLKIRLRVLIPAVENAIDGNAFRPLDVYPSRKGLSVEIGNTDAEGRLVLADALTLADEEAPELLVDMGTLTGAARVALGPDLPPFYTDDEDLAASLAAHAAAEHDPLWRMPLWHPYDQMIESKTADVNNVGTSGFAGSILCALFLARFVSEAKRWLHLDIYAWTPSAKPGRPEGGECQAARALYALLCERYG